MNEQFQLTEQHFLNAGYQHNRQIGTPADCMKGLVCQFYRTIKDVSGKRFTIHVKGYSMPENCPVRVVYDFEAQLQADDPISVVNVSFGSGINPTDSTIEDIEFKFNLVWERLGNHYND